MGKSKSRLRFEKVASKRVQNILNSLASLSKCSNKYNYEYTKEDVDKMIREIKASVSTTEASFKGSLHDSHSRFKF